MIRVCAAAVALLVALTGVGCGDGDETADRFREGYNAAIERLNEVNSSIEESGQELAGKSGEEIAGEFDRIADAAERTRSNLAELKPPEDARDELDDLLAAIEGGVTDIRGVADAARQENRARFREAAEQLSESGQEISDAEAALKDAVDAG